MVEVSALSTGENGLNIWLARSLGIITNLFTQTFLSALEIQVDEEELLVYVLVVQFIWMPFSSFIRPYVARYSATGLGWRYHNLTLIDFISQVTLFLTFGMISKVLGKAWSSGAFTPVEIAVYGILMVILFFIWYTYVRVMFVDMYGMLALYKKLRKGQ